MNMYLLIIVLSSPLLFAMESAYVNDIEQPSQVDERRAEWPGDQNVGVQSQIEESDARAVENAHEDSSQKTLNIVIATSKASIPAELLPENWYRQIIEEKLVKSRDGQGQPIIILEIEDTLLPAVKEALYLMTMLDGLSEYKAMQVAYKTFKRHTLSLAQSATLIVTLDYLLVSKPLISAMARICAELTGGNEPDLGLLSSDVRREINYYFYLLYGRYIEGEPKGGVWLQDLIKFKRLDMDIGALVLGGTLELESLSLAHICRLGKLLKLSKDVIFRVNLSGNMLTHLPEHFLRYMHSLKELRLGGNKLVTLPEDLGQEGIQLAVVIINNNQLTSVPGGFARNWLFLKVLMLGGNKLTVLPEDFCQGCPLLESLVLSKNHLRSLPQGFARNWPALKRLLLGDNQLTTLPGNFTQECLCLEYLGLENNSFIELPEQCIHCWGQLTALKQLKLENDDLKRSVVRLEPALKEIIDVPM